MTNLFFTITAIAVIVLSLVVLFILINVLKIIRSIRRVVERIEEGAEAIAEDAARLREELSKGGLIARLIGQVIQMGSAHAEDIVNATVDHVTKQKKKSPKTARATKTTATKKKGVKMKIKKA